MTEFGTEDVALVGRLSLPDSHSNTPIDFRTAAHGARLYSPFKIQLSMRKQTQNAWRYPKDDPRLETIYISSPLGSLRHSTSSVAGGAALPVPLHSPPAHRYAHPFPGRIKRKLKLGTHPHWIFYVNWSDCDSTLSTMRTSKTPPVKLTALMFFF